MENKLKKHSYQPGKENKMQKKIENQDANSKTEKIAPLQIANQTPNEIFKERYISEKEIGKGAFGRVLLAFDKEQETKVALKIVDKSIIKTDKIMRHLQRELEISPKLKHPNIVECFDVFQLNDGAFGFVLQYIPGVDLYGFLHKNEMTKSLSRIFFRQIANAVFYLHSKNICHRDLKLENILVDNQKKIRLIDFGLSIECKKDELLDEYCGSKLYVPPEVINKKPYLGPPVDMWALGVLLFIFEYKKMPFSEQRPKLADQIKNARYKEPFPPSEASKLIKLMLTICPKKRAKIDAVCRSQWINFGCQQPLQIAAKNLVKIDEQNKKCEKKQDELKIDSEIIKAENKKVSQKVVPKSDSQKRKSLKSAPLI